MPGQDGKRTGNLIPSSAKEDHNKVTLFLNDVYNPLPVIEDK